MAERKYDIFLGPKRPSNAKIQHQPWYRERLILKYKQEVRPKLDASRWTFLDHRDNNNTSSPGDSVSVRRSIEPIIALTTSARTNENTQRRRMCVGKLEAVFSKVFPRQAKRREEVEELERELLNNRDTESFIGEIGKHTRGSGQEQEVAPLNGSALSVQSEKLFSDNCSNEVQSSSDHKAGSVHSTYSESSVDREPIPGYTQAIRNLLHRDTTGDRQQKVPEDDSNIRTEDKASRGAPGAGSGGPGRRRTLQSSTLIPLTEVEKVTKDFCDWLKNVETHEQGLNIDENEVKEAFIGDMTSNSSSEYRPTGQTFHVTETANLPREVKDVLSSRQGSRDFHEESRYTPSWSRKKTGHTSTTGGGLGTKYGVWYIEPTMWQTYSDPMAKRRTHVTSTKQKSDQLNEVLGSLHGAQSFKKFVKKKGPARTPEFLDSMSFGSPENPGVGAGKGGGAGGCKNRKSATPNVKIKLSIISE